MGKAKRRRAAARTLPKDIRDEIAAIVQQQNSFVFGDGQGQYYTQRKGHQCLWRALTGHVALDLLGITTRLVSGSVLYGTGPGRDTLDIALHFWLMAAEQLIDFSVADWRDAVGSSSLAWTVAPPCYHWGDRALFDRTHGHELPPLGVALYFGFVDRLMILRQLRDSSRMPLLQKLKPLLVQANLINRVKAVAVENENTRR
jgi:hypothetical protein